MKFEASSSIIALIFNGKIPHILNPWKIIIDTNDEYIIVRKRNWYLIGVDQQVLSFRYIRNISIDQHLFGSDIHIKIIGGKNSAYYISKSNVNKIKSMLLEYNKTRRGKTIIFS
jgi:hypothetical protein